MDVDVNDGVYVNDEMRIFENDSGISFPVIRKEYWKRALSQAQQDHERKQSFQQDVHGENQNTFKHVKVKLPPKPFEPTKEERQSHEATHCPFRAWCEICIKAKSPHGKHTKQLGNPEHILVVAFDCAFATETLGDQNFDDGCDRLKSWINFCCCGKEKRWPGRLCDAEVSLTIDENTFLKRCFLSEVFAKT